VDALKWAYRLHMLPIYRWSGNMPKERLWGAKDRYTRTTLWGIQIYI